jgi:hypothetical protein
MENKKWATRTEKEIFNSDIFTDDERKRINWIELTGETLEVYFLDGTETEVNISQFQRYLIGLKINLQ